jgi:hypothetical protein
VPVARHQLRRHARPGERGPQIKQDPRGYHILEEINVRPAVTYLAKVLRSEPVAHAAPGGGEHN